MEDSENQIIEGGFKSPGGYLMWRVVQYRVGNSVPGRAYCCITEGDYVELNLLKNKATNTRCLINSITLDFNASTGATLAWRIELF